MDFDLEWESGFDPDNVQGTFERMLETADDRLMGAMTESTLNIEKGASQRSRRRSGTMANAWGSKVESRGNTIVAEVGNETHYAVHHEYGTKDITPAPMLRPAIDEEIRNLEREVRMAVIEASEQEGTA
ncbi:HK97 gp10 family phage protein [Natronobacterium gregoryi]|uniref:Phage protein, HK97 gp10 family n=2 Tax=Natronobacterium gregoryi TaxID=44930 RepID=L0AGU5_NATGS|nr:HK97 gp10 family phage protein [Natronobacterium gregoryi]AFZ73041.1 Bacteriophage protein of unknown function (DUF646) [Natronobacterium gregoryi SP2]ELY70853.1 phage protein, HK97 gp10 family [Natronobacterium gregoryi SP2]PLK20434.1 hypothetical protein CYV19_09915 [Natronobacterium gregoryi SP2]SFI62949.1 Bacteriophage HK97-gp10, putative tail-component [Natronobacterium gregoryi]